MSRPDAFKFYAHVIAALFLVVAPAWAIHPIIGLFAAFGSLLALELVHGVFDAYLSKYTAAMWSVVLTIHPDGSQ